MGVTFTYSLGQSVKHFRTDLVGTVDSLMVDRDNIQWALFEHVNINHELKSKWVREVDLVSA